jgi:hypothetical protein
VYDIGAGISGLWGCMGIWMDMIYIDIPCQLRSRPCHEFFLDQVQGVAFNDRTFTTALMIKRCYRFSTLRQEISGILGISWYIMVHRHAVSCLLVNSQEFQSFVGSTSKFIWSIPSHEQSRKLQVHGKDIQKLERSHRLPVCTRMMYVKLGGNRLKDNYVHAQLWHNLPRGYRYFERAHRHYGNPNVHPPWFQAWKMQHLPKNIRE